MYLTRVIRIDHKTDIKEDVDAFNEYVESLVTTINHTPYTVLVIETWETGETLQEE